MFHNDADSTQSIERMCILYTLTSTDLSTCTDTNRHIFFFFTCQSLSSKSSHFLAFDVKVERCLIVKKKHIINILKQTSDRILLTKSACTLFMSAGVTSSDVTNCIFFMALWF